MGVGGTIERFIIDKQLLKNRRTKVDPDESLFTIGVLDSLAFLQMIAFIEEQFRVTIADGDVVPHNFDTINRIKALVERKQEEKALLPDLLQ